MDNIKSLSFEKGVYSECYLKTSDNRYRKIIRNKLTPLELELFNTESGEDEKLFKFIKSFKYVFGSMAETIDAYVRLKYGQNADDFNFFTSIDEFNGEQLFSS